MGAGEMGECARPLTPGGERLTLVGDSSYTVLSKDGRLRVQYGVDTNLLGREAMKNFCSDHRWALTYLLSTARGSRAALLVSTTNCI